MGTQPNPIYQAAFLLPSPFQCPSRLLTSFWPLFQSEKFLSQLTLLCCHLWDQILTCFFILFWRYPKGNILYCHRLAFKHKPKAWKKHWHSGEDEAAGFPWTKSRAYFVRSGGDSLPGLSCEFYGPFIRKAIGTRCLNTGSWHLLWKTLNHGCIS